MNMPMHNAEKPIQMVSEVFSVTDIGDEGGINL
jgi:hypothetical protein